MFTYQETRLAGLKIMKAILTACIKNMEIDELPFSLE